MGKPGEAAEAVQAVHVLLATSRDWFASALGAVLEPEGFTFSHVRSGEGALADVTARRPDIVVIDEGLPDASAADLCRGLIRGPLGTSIPVLVYSPNFWHETEQAEAMRAGAWDIIREPIRSKLLVAKLERLLQIKRLIESTEREALSDTDTGLFNLSGLLRTLPVLGSLAERSDTSLSCAVVGPTRPAEGDVRRRQRADTALLCQTHTRMSDLCGWVADTDIAVVAYGTDVAGATVMARRLGALAGPAPDGEAGAEEVLSAGVVELPVDEFVAARRRALAQDPPDPRPITDQIASLGRFAAAQDALRQAREAGGGIRIAGST